MTGNRDRSQAGSRIGEDSSTLSTSPSPRASFAGRVGPAASRENDTSSQPAPYREKDSHLDFEGLALARDVKCYERTIVQLLSTAEQSNNSRLWLQLIQFRKRLYGSKGVISVWKAFRRQNANRALAGVEAQGSWKAFFHSAAAELCLSADVANYLSEKDPRHGRVSDGLLESILGRTSSQCLEPLGDVEALFNNSCVTKNGPADLQTIQLHEAGQRPVSDSTLRIDNHKLPSISEEPISSESEASQPRIFNDHLCAKAFATTSFSVEIIMEMLGILGIRRLGPVSFRELAARLQTPQMICQNVQRLEELGIAIQETVFTRAVLCCAKEDRTDLLLRILATDLHPDAFEDVTVQRKLLAHYVRGQKWTDVHLTLFILGLHKNTSVYASWNVFFRASVLHASHLQLVRVIEDMRVYGVSLQASSISYLLRYRLRRRKPGKKPATVGDSLVDDLSLVAQVCLESIKRGYLVDPKYLHELICRYGQLGRYSELCCFAIWLARLYQTPTSNAAKMRHLRSEYAYISLHHSRPSKSDRAVQPMKQLFSLSLVREVIIWAFKSANRHYTSTRPQRIIERYDCRPCLFRKKIGNRNCGLLHRSSNLLRPAADKPTFRSIVERNPSIIDGITLVSLLKQQGVAVEESYVRKVVTQRLWILHGPGESTVPENRIIRKYNRSTLLQTLVAVNEAWGEDMFHLEPQLRRPLSTENLSLQWQTLGSRLRQGALPHRSAVARNLDRQSGTISVHGACVPENEVMTMTAVHAEAETLLLSVFGARRWIHKRRRRGVTIKDWARSLSRKELITIGIPVYSGTST